MPKDFKSPVAITRIATVVLGIIKMGVGLHSHFESVWAKTAGIDGYGKKVSFRDAACASVLAIDKSCPSLSLERYYVSMVIITFILSIVLLVASFLIDLSANPYKLVDMGYHAVGAVLLFIGAIVYFVSATQIDKLFLKTNPDGLRRDEKLAAGALTIIQCLLFGVLTFLIARKS